MLKSLSLIAGLAWITLSLMYYNIFDFVSLNYKYDYGTSISLNYIKSYNESADFLINTTGCYIPNYAKTFQFTESQDYHQSCGQRYVFIEKISKDSIMYIIDWKKLKKKSANLKRITCCYQYVSRSTVISQEDSHITYSSCVPFKNGTRTKLEKEIVKVTCGGDPVKKHKVVYEDSYIILKKIQKRTPEKKRDSWNVLMIGMDTMSRGRAISSMPKTVSYLKSNGWLDYRGYQKVAFNTFPNLMSVLTGNKMSTVSATCKPTMDECKNSMIWTKFREAGYVTAYGEDFLRLPDTFSSYGFRVSPTDHYTRPFFLTGERETGNIVCAHTEPSAYAILDYASDFANAYKEEQFFGLFWLNSYSHNKLNSPVLFDEKVVQFLENLEHSGVHNNTFIMFLSDHGIRYGKMRFAMESYYEERLPMLYMWVPPKFRQTYGERYYNLQLNQDRLTSHLDLHMTLWNILKMHNQSINIINSEACPLCKSLFERVPTNRTCADAGISEKWCTCHKLLNVSGDDEGAKRSLQLAVANIQSITSNITTVACTICRSLSLKTVLRRHVYSDNSNKTYYVIAFLMAPGDVGFETKVMRDGDNYNLVETTESITEYNTRGNCVIKKYERAYCVCAKLKKCT